LRVQRPQVVGARLVVPPSGCNLVAEPEAGRRARTRAPGKSAGPGLVSSRAGCQASRPGDRRPRVGSLRRVHPVATGSADFAQLVACAVSPGGVSAAPAWQGV